MIRNSSLSDTAGCTWAARMMASAFGALALVALLGGAAPASAANKSQFSAYQHGKPVDYLPCGSTPVRNRAAALMGGGLDVKPAFTWLITKMAECADGSTGKPGNLVVIRAGGNPSYDSYIAKLGTLASVVTIVVPTPESANDPAIEPYIRSAGAVFLTGGDQGDYYNFWKGSLLEKLLSAHVATYGIPVSGTSAGMMILSEFNYIAYPYTITSLEALANPFKDGSVTVKNDFWTNGTPFAPLTDTVADSHFDTRDRMGRLITFMARTVDSGWVKLAGAKAIGVAQETALLMEYPNTKTPGVVMMNLRTVANPDVNGAAYLLSGTSSSALFVKPGQPLTFTNISVQKLPANGSPVNYQINVRGGLMTSTTGSIY